MEITLSPQTWIIVAMVSVGIVLSVPVLYMGFTRRGKGVIYKKDFLLQRAPQLVSLLNVGIVFIGFIGANRILTPDWQPVVTLAPALPAEVVSIISWLGVLVLASGLVFMIGGWYSLGECFSTDAELLDGQTVRRTGLLAYVMHPAYSGIIQSLLGAGIASLCWPALVLTITIVAPLWLRRAKYEEQLLLETFGQDYSTYASELKWRRLIPRFIPIGV